MMTASSNLPDRPPTRHRAALVVMVLAVGALLFPIINRYTYHPGETVIVLMPPVLGAVLWILWPSVRRIPWWHHALYLAFLIAVIAAAITFAAHMARGRVLWIEVFWTVYFAVGWRLAWAIWRRTVGRLGERRRRWARRCRRSIRVTGHQPTAPQRRALLAARFISPARALAVVLVFIPLFFGSMIHRMKIGNPPDPAAFTDLDVEPVSFITADGLLLDGWFVPNGDSDATVIICHGLGANKGNFAEFLQLFRGPGYNSLIFDFRGHGDSAGHTTTFGLYGDRDVRAAVDWLKSARPERARHVLGIGSSMGAMSLVRAAANDPRIEAVVLDSCCLSAPRLAEQHLGVIPVIGPLYGKVLLAVLSLNAGRSLWDLDLGDAIARLSPRPVLLIQGEDDIIIPPANLELLYERAGEPKEEWLAPGPHSNILTTDFAQYQARVQHFFDRALGRETRNAP